MAIEGFPLDSEVLGIGQDGLPIYSNSYDSRSLRRVNRKFFKQGVFDGDMLEPSFSYAPGYADNSSPYVKVSVGSGAAILDGCVATVDEGFELGVINAPVPPDTKNVTKNRVDRIVITLEKGGAEESVHFEQLQGETNTGSTMPPAPALTRNGTKYQICIAEFDCVSYLDSNGNARYVYEMTDTRLDDYLCGLASALVDVDTTQFYESMNAMIANLNSATETAVELSRNALDETVAGELTNRIVALEGRFDENGDLLPTSIADGSVGTAKLADDSVSSEKLNKSLRDSLSRKCKLGSKAIAGYVGINRSIGQLLQVSVDDSDGGYTLMISDGGVRLYDKTTDTIIHKVDWSK